MKNEYEKDSYFSWTELSTGWEVGGNYFAEVVWKVF